MKHETPIFEVLIRVELDGVDNSFEGDDALAFISLGHFDQANLEGERIERYACTERSASVH